MSEPSEICLFIGGPQDGRRLRMDPNKVRCDFMGRDRTLASTYRETILPTGPGLSTRVFTLGEMTMAETVGHLVTGYRRPLS